MTAATLRPPKRPSIVVMFTPLRDEDVLVPGEVYYYRRKAHWASMIMPGVETAAIIVLALVVVAGTVPTENTAFIAALIVAGMTIWRMVRERTWSWLDKTMILLGALIIVSAGVGLPSLAALTALAALARYGVALLRWAHYEVRYVTNRRVLEISGMLGRRISTMPLSKVTDITLKRGVGGELFDYGELRVESAGQEQALGRIPYLIDDQLFHDVLIHLSTDEA